MTIYKGNTLLSNITINNLNIDKIYKGNTLLYQKNNTNLYITRLNKGGSFTGYKYFIHTADILEGGLVSSLSNVSVSDNTIFKQKILSIIGELGAVNSQVIIKPNNKEVTYNYRYTFNLASKEIFLYVRYDPESEDPSVIKAHIYVMKNSTINNYGIFGNLTFPYFDEKFFVPFNITDTNLSIYETENTITTRNFMDENYIWKRSYIRQI